MHQKNILYFITKFTTLEDYKNNTFKQDWQKLSKVYLITVSSGVFKVWPSIKWNNMNLIFSLKICIPQTIANTWSLFEKSQSGLILVEKMYIMVYFKVCTNHPDIILKYWFYAIRIRLNIDDFHNYSACWNLSDHTRQLCHLLKR